MFSRFVLQQHVCCTIFEYHCGSPDFRLDIVVVVQQFCKFVFDQSMKFRTLEVIQKRIYRTRISPPSHLLVTVQYLFYGECLYTKSFDNSKSLFKQGLSISWSSLKILSTSVIYRNDRVHAQVSQEHVFWAFLEILVFVNIL